MHAFPTAWSGARPVPAHDPEGRCRDPADADLNPVQLHRVITRVRRGHTIRALVSLGVDEISFCKGRKFATLV